MNQTTRPARWKALVGILAVGIIVLAALGTWQMVVKNRPAPVPVSDQADVRRDVQDATKETLNRVLDYDYDLVDDTIAENSAMLTGDALEKYPDWIKAKRAASQANPSGQEVTVLNTGVESLSEDKATTLSFVKFSAFTATNTTDTKASVRVDLIKVDRKWLVSRLPVIDKT